LMDSITIRDTCSAENQFKGEHMRKKT